MSVPFKWIDWLPSFCTNQKCFESSTSRFYLWFHRLCSLKCHPPRCDCPPWTIKLSQTFSFYKDHEKWDRGSKHLDLPNETKTLISRVWATNHPEQFEISPNPGEALQRWTEIFRPRGEPTSSDVEKNFFLAKFLFSKRLKYFQKLASSQIRQVSVTGKLIAEYCSVIVGVILRYFWWASFFPGVKICPWLSFLMTRSGNERVKR